jgi:hypothetical protein
LCKSFVIVSKKYADNFLFNDNIFYRITKS